MNHPSAPLAHLLESITTNQGEPDPDQLLTLFLEYTTDLGFELYPAQEEAILELFDYKHVMLNTPTGSGKSLVAMALHFKAMAEHRISYYTCPIKALVNEKFFDLCEAFGAENVGLLTGDASVNPDAPIICCTAEILSNRALREAAPAVDYVVMDEFHFYGDKERGIAWQIPLVSLPDTVFLMMSATLGDTAHIIEPLSAFTRRDVATISYGERPVPLTFSYSDSPLQETIQSLLDDDEAPIYLVNFTQRACAEQAQNLLSINVTDKQEKKAIARQLDGLRFNTPYGKEFLRFIRAGIGVHHAGLLPRYRLLVEKLAQAGLLKVVSGTDSLGVGVNIPIRTVVFTQLSKFDGEKTRLLSARQFHQISGRAGRRGFDDHGSVVVQAPEHVVENKRLEAKLVKHPHLKNKLKKKKPPTRGFVHWDKGIFERLVSSPPEQLTPHFAITHGMIINALQSEITSPGGGYRRLIELIGRFHGTAGQKRYARRRAAALFKSLIAAETTEIIAAPDRPGKIMRVRPGLQPNFSLNHTLSLYLIEALELLDPTSPTFALDTLTLVESILEDPRAVLLRQKDKIKDKLYARLKAEGVSYDELIDELEKVEYPKPNAEFIYQTFNAFAKHHPWVDGENIKPKSIAREMFEQCWGFNDYVNELGISRAEGVLLRYLSQLYKTAYQNVPESSWDEAFLDQLAYFRTLLGQVDSSLIEEWEQLLTNGPAQHQDNAGPAAVAQRPEALDADPKAFAARVRSELHLLLRTLAIKDFESACTQIRQTEEHSWTAHRFADELAPYFEAHGGIDLTPQARQAHNTVLRKTEHQQWVVMQKIIDPEGDEDWGLDCRIDLSRIEDREAPLLELLRIGV